MNRMLTCVQVTQLLACYPTCSALSGPEVRVLPGQLSGALPPTESHRGHSDRSLPLLVSCCYTVVLIGSCVCFLDEVGLKLPPSLRLLKDNLQDSQFSARYQHLLAALLCCAGRALRDEFDRQCWLVSILTKVAQRVRDAAPSIRQVGLYGA